VNNDHKVDFTQQSGALSGFKFDFFRGSKTQSFSGSFEAPTNFYGAKSALERAGISVSYLDQGLNALEMYNNWSLVNFRSQGDPNTGAGSVHVMVDPGEKVGLTIPTTGKLHGYETNPSTDPIGHLKRDLPWPW
jgi:hypothetical protein